MEHKILSWRTFYKAIYLRKLDGAKCSPTRLRKAF